MKRKIINKGASIRAKLLNLADETKTDYNYLLRRFFQERFLARLSVSPFREKLILKGALLLLSYKIENHRPTKDMDFLGDRISNDFKNINSILSGISAIHLDDGVVFDSNTITVESIMEAGMYQGIRAYVRYKMDSIAGKLQIDIGFGDIIVGGPNEIHFPVLIDGTPPCILVYSIESSFAEKLEAAVKRNFASSRLKDFYDMYFLAQNYRFSATRLKQAISAVFTQRATDITQLPVLFSDEFKNDPSKNKQWNSFLQRNDISPDLKFPAVIECIQSILQPVLNNEE